MIIGNGITGITAARFIRKLSDAQITVIASETDHFYARTALMYIYMGHMRYRDTKPYEDHFWEKNRIHLERGYVTEVDTSEKVVSFGHDRTVRYDKLLLATGSKSNRFGWPGQDLPGVQGLYGMDDLALMERNTKGIDRGVVVGGGLIGVEMAEMLHARGIPVTFLVREASYMDYLLPEAESEMVNREIRRHHVDLRLSTELVSILGRNRVEQVNTSAGDTVPCQFVGLTAGVHPNTDLAKASGVACNRGILVNEYFETSASDVYAAGDCAEFERNGIGSRRIEQLWYTGRAHGRTVAFTLCARRTPYRRGVFFNSAKFFTIEYQTYGDVPAHPVPGIESRLVQEGNRLIRICYNSQSGAVTGFNAMGVRLRQDRCEAWIQAGTDVDTVVRTMRKARFDTEFYSKRLFRAVLTD